MELRSSLGRVRGLGSAKEGVGPWWAQRVTAIALVPLSIWFIVSIISLLGADYASYKAWSGLFGNALLLRQRLAGDGGQRPPAGKIK